MSTPNDDDENQFNLAQFNHNFLLQYEAKEKRRRKKEAEVLEQLNQPSPPPRLRDQSVSQLAYGCKDTLFEVLDDVFQFRFPVRLWKETPRLYHLGIIFIVVSWALLLFYSFHSDTRLVYFSSRHANIGRTKTGTYRGKRAKRALPPPGLGVWGAKFFDFKGSHSTSETYLGAIFQTFMGHFSGTINIYPPDFHIKI